MGRKHRLIPRPSVLTLHMKGKSGNKTIGRKPGGGGKKRDNYEYKYPGIKIINIIHALKHTIGNLSC